MYLSQVNKEYEKRTVLILYIHCKKLQESQSSFSHLFLVFFPSSAMLLISSISSFTLWTGLFWKKLQI